MGNEIQGHCFHGDDFLFTFSVGRFSYDGDFTKKGEEVCHSVRHIVLITKPIKNTPCCGYQLTAH